MGGTFTDVVLEREDGRVSHVQGADDPGRPGRGDPQRASPPRPRRRAAASAELLGATEVLVHGTTRATNAILTGTTAKTAFLTTAGHPDILVFRLGGRENPFDHSREYPGPLRAALADLRDRRAPRLPRARSSARSTEASVYAAAEATARAEGSRRSASACSGRSPTRPTSSPSAAILAAELPGVAVTLSHQPQPDRARVPPRLLDLHRRLAEATDDRLPGRASRAGWSPRGSPAGCSSPASAAACSTSARLAEAPIHSINSGPALAPTAGRHHARRRVRRGHRDRRSTPAAPASTSASSAAGGSRAPARRWLGAPLHQPPHRLSLGRRADDRLGRRQHRPRRRRRPAPRRPASRRRRARARPATAAAAPQPTVTDACMLLGYLDPRPARGTRHRRRLRRRAPRRSPSRSAEPLGLDRDAAAAAVVRVVTEQMVYAIEEVTVEQGVDPREACLVSGGGAAGLQRRPHRPPARLPRPSSSR